MLSVDGPVHLLGGKGMMDSPLSSPLPPEDCTVSALHTYSAMSERKERSNAKSQSLFNVDVDLSDEVKNPANHSLVANLNVDDIIKTELPVNVDAWSLLQDFESLYQTSTTNPTPNCEPTASSSAETTTTPPPPSALEHQQALEHHQLNLSQLISMEGQTSPADYLNCLDEEEEVPMFADLDELHAMLCDAESESAANSVTTTLDLAAVTALFALGDYPDQQPEVTANKETLHPHTSDLLADLITGTILVDPSLEGLLSNTTLDFSSVFGETVVTANCNTNQIEQNDDVRSVDSCSPVSAIQEVPEISTIVKSSSSSKRKNTKINSDNISSKMDRSSIKRSRLGSSVSNCSEDKSVVVRLGGPDDDEPVNIKRPRHVSGGSSVSSSSSKAENKFVEMRKKNNEASKRSRYARKQKYTQMEQEMLQLEKKNKLLTSEADRLEKMVNTLKEAMFKHVQKV